MNLLIKNIYNFGFNFLFALLLDFLNIYTKLDCIDTTLKNEWIYKIWIGEELHYKNVK